MKELEYFAFISQIKENRKGRACAGFAGTEKMIYKEGSKATAYKETIVRELSVSNVVSCLYCPFCFWAEEHDLPLPSLGRGIDSHLMSKARGISRDEERYLEAIRAPFGKTRRFGRTALSSAIIENRLGLSTFFAGAMQCLFRGAIDDCFFDGLEKCYIPVAWKIAGALRDEAKFTEVAKLNCYALLFGENGLAVQRSVLCVMLPNGSKEPWGYQAQIIKPSPNFGLHLLRRAVTIMELRRPPKPSSNCERCKYVRAVKKYL